MISYQKGFFELVLPNNYKKILIKLILKRNLKKVKIRILMMNKKAKSYFLKHLIFKKKKLFKK